ncbi:MAG TPA: lysophospholipid acyltransferase family protein [Candidatus Sumerlaeota bacterium]|nr:lysophospholipid acyltransferase family protein [Candidatus Sumerlaeota bacterium]HOR27968.1 lysophospholipid acyltransferase family protein [Candidatus Sumerlaeota bacterium]HPK01780.1 lysophospholipid acyltransferase family protein [Candidatus Sumerlaeota bacterium]
MSASQLTKPGQAPARLPAVEPWHPGLRGFYRFTHFVMSTVARLYCRREVIGLEHFPPSGPALILPTHSSFIDPPMVGAALNREIYALSRAEILEVPLLGWLCRRFYHGVPIRRGGGDREALRLCRRILRAGWPLLYFPEGQRTPTGTMQPLQRGWILILDDLPGVPWIPVQMQSTYHIMRRGQLFPRPRKLRIVFGKPRPLPERRPGENSRQWHARCNAELEQALRDLGAV